MAANDVADLSPTKGAPRKPAPLHIDPIDPKLPGRFNVTNLQRNAARYTEPWVHEMTSLIGFIGTPSQERKWCGLAAIPSLEASAQARNHTARPLHGIVEELSCSILERLAVSPKNGEFSKLFLVPKTDTVSRIILDCRGLNALCDRPPKLLFASVQDVFRMLAFFEHTFTATADFRHWFYQLPLAKPLRDLFCLQCGPNTYRLKVWAMGFSWSPFIAQSISMTIARGAIENVEGWWAVAPTRDTSAPPPFWMVCTRNTTYQLLLRGEIRGFVLFWYDNLLVIADSEEVRERLRRSIQEVALEYNAEWKGIETNDGFVVDKDAVSYLGFEARKESPQHWTWRHVEDNREAWTSLTHDPPTWLKAAQMIGVLIWDWLVAGARKGTLGPVLAVARRIGRQNLRSPKDWNRKPPAHGVGITEKEWEELLIRIRRACSSTLNRYEGHVPSAFNREILLASDAMDKRGAGAWLKGGHISPRVIWVSEFGEAGDKHINWKETKAAIATLKAAMQKRPGKYTLYIIAVDNTVACAVLKAGYVPWDPELTAELTHLRQVLRTQGSDYLVVHIPGNMQPADEPSRGQELLPGKVGAAVEWLESKNYPWWALSGEQREESTGIRGARVEL